MIAKEQWRGKGLEWGWWGLAIAVSLIILGLRWQVVRLYTNDLPEWDQWDAEGLHVLAQWYHKSGFWSGLWLPQNEHRCVITKLVNWTVVMLNGHWDQRLQAALNVALPITMAVLMLRWLKAHATPLTWPIAAVVFCALWAFPVAWHNVVAAFHSAQFFLVITAWITVTRLPFAPVGTRSWWVGITAATLGLVTMASGFLAALCAIVLILLRWVVKKVPIKPHVPTLLICAVLTVAGYKMGVTVPAHEPLKAHSFSAFWTTLMYAMRWPTGHTFLVLLMWLPLGALVVEWMRRDAASGPKSSALALIGMGGWVFAQMLAAAVFRGAHGVEPAPRYLDTLVVGCAINGLALAWLITRWRGNALRGAIAVGVAWTGVLLWGLTGIARHTFEVDLPSLNGYRAEVITTTRDYISTGNPAALLQARIPYPGVENFRMRVDIPSLQRIMPASVRAPLAIEGGVTPGPFVFSGRPQMRDPNTGILNATPNGLPPGFPKLGMESVIGSGHSAESGSWRSDTLNPEGAFLRFEIAGTWEDPRVTLELCDSRTGAILSRVLPPKPAFDTWQTAFVAVPDRPFFIQARDESPEGWIAFSRPRVEVRGSSVARRLLPEGKFLAQVGVTLLVVASLLITWRARPVRTVSRHP